jgi:hypothetical protein
MSRKRITKKTEKRVPTPAEWNTLIFNRMKELFPGDSFSVAGNAYQGTVWGLLDLIEDIQAQRLTYMWPAARIDGYFDGIRDALAIPRRKEGVA